MSYSHTLMLLPADEGLVRAIGLRRLTASIVNVTIGAGIFVLPAIVADGLGAAAPLAYVVCAAAMLLILICFATAGSRVSLTGGLYAYVSVAFGPYIGFLTGILYTLAAVFAVASVASAFAGSLGAIWTVFAGPIARAAVIAGLFAVLAMVNIRGVAPGARLIETVTVAKLLPLIVLICAGLFAIGRHGSAMHVDPSWPQASALGRTAILLIFAFIGVEVALVPSGEIRDSARTVPRALFAALTITTLVYVAVQYVAQALLGAELPAHAAAPLADAAGQVLGARGRALILGGAVVSMFGYVAGDMLGTPRTLFAFGRDGILPRVFARVQPRFHTPDAAIAIYAMFVATLAISSSFTQLAILANVASLSMYLLCVAGSWELQRRDVRTAGAPFSSPGGPIVPIAASAAILWLLAHATRREIGIQTLVLAAAILFYVIRKGPASSASSTLRADT
jgi:basic amino acid/polyamine antiporter, APA family